ncbi:MAG: hypothetical protein HC895_06480 [Leptolyngbyaceae cyanobacterium SM1_3_5]|nr:hypothetical protein [Leptolyngbyaceae cyanobacterium SM1_3_5]
MLRKETRVEPILGLMKLVPSWNCSIDRSVVAKKMRSQAQPPRQSPAMNHVFFRRSAALALAAAALLAPAQISVAQVVTESDAVCWRK